VFPNITKLDHKGTPGEQVLAFIQRHGLVRSAQTLLVGVSGGADSVCLLHLLAKLKEELGVELHVAHLNHMLRNGESQDDAEYVSKLSDRLGLRSTIEQRDVSDYQRKHHLSLEEAAREVRYQFFAQVASSVGTNQVAVGHTADDQVETILMHLVRGGGTHGLRGIQPLTSWKSAQGIQLTVARPLLEVSRREAETYCQEYRLNPRQDSSNLLTTCFRNRIRHELIPQLQEYNPNIKQGLLRTGQALAEVHSFLEEQLPPVWGKVISERNGTLVLRAGEISRLHPALQRHLLREALRHLLGDLKDIEWRHIESMRKALTLAPGKRVCLPRGLTLSVEYGECVIGTDSASLPSLVLKESELKLPGETQLPGWSVEATFFDQPQRATALCKDATGNSLASASAPIAHLDASAAGNKLMVRGRRPGDRFQPLGMGQPKKIQDFMVDAHIPRACRDQVPLVCSPEQILWVVGWRIADRAKVTEDTRRVLRLEFKEVNSCQRREQYETAS